MQQFEGGHFYIVSHQAEVLVSLSNQLLAAVADLPPSILDGGDLVHPGRQCCVHELFDRQVAKTPDSLAVVGLRRELTYTQLAEEVDLLARELQRVGVCAETPVGL